jgi:hypothetical protein
MRRGQQPDLHTPEINRYKGQFASKLEDYAVSLGDAASEFEGLALTIRAPIDD